MEIGFKKTFKSSKEILNASHSSKLIGAREVLRQSFRRRIDDLISKPFRVQFASQLRDAGLPTCGARGHVCDTSRSKHPRNAGVFGATALYTPAPKLSFESVAPRVGNQLFFDCLHHNVFEAGRFALIHQLAHRGGRNLGIGADDGCPLLPTLFLKCELINPRKLLVA